MNRGLGVVVVLAAASLAACEVPKPLSPAEPIGEFPTWGADFSTPREQPTSLLGTPGAPAESTSTGGAQMPGAIKSFSGGDATQGKGIYLALCARCHGAGGEGGALPGNVVVPAFNDAKFQDSLTDAQMARGIALGKGQMPGFMQDLDRDKLANVIAYIRTLKK
jgi:mono/diheme cytochrome c family protein